MNNFIWGCPAQFYFGKDMHAKIGEVMAQHGWKKALLIYGGGSAIRSGLIESAVLSLSAAGVDVVLHGGVRPNPEVNFVREAIEVARAQEVDCVLAIGGGSVIDASKAVAFGVFYEGDVWDFFEKRAVIKQCLPIVCVLTIPAAGSESSSSCVISNDALKLKRGVSSEVFRPKIAFMDPSLTCTLPPYQTAAGATDMIAHICERWFSGVGAVPVTDATAAGLIRTIMEATRACLANPNDYDARANLMWAGTLAHNGIAGVGRNLVPDGRAGGWESHALEHELSAHVTSITHGAGLAVVLPAWMRYVWREDPQRFLDFGAQVFGIAMQGEGEEAARQAVYATIDALQAFFVEIGMPKTLGELGITQGDIPALLETLEQNKGKVFGAFRKLDAGDARAIYESAL